MGGADGVAPGTDRGGVEAEGEEGVVAEMQAMERAVRELSGLLDEIAEEDEAAAAETEAAAVASVGEEHARMRPGAGGRPG